MSERRQLTVELALDGSTLVRRYYRDVYGEILKEPSQVPLRSIGNWFEYEGDRGLVAVAKLLAVGKVEDLADHLTGSRLTDVGRMLFDALFFEDGDGPTGRCNWQRVLLPLFDQPEGSVMSPIQQPVRLRVCTQDDAFTGLPWRTSSYNSYRLADSHWTFEVTPFRDADARVDLPAPAKVLIVAPRFRDMPHIATENHIKAVKDVLGTVWPGHDKGLVEVVETRSALQSMLKGMRPNLLYYYGHGKVEGEQVLLLLGSENDSAQTLLASDLTAMLQGDDLKLAYLNGCLTGAAGQASFGHQLAPKVPLVLSNVTTAWADPAAHTALQLLRDCPSAGGARKSSI